jgi:hypothetical protein
MLDVNEKSADKGPSDFGLQNLSSRAKRPKIKRIAAEA